VATVLRRGSRRQLSLSTQQAWLLFKCTNNENMMLVFPTKIYQFSQCVTCAGPYFGLVQPCLSYISRRG